MSKLQWFTWFFLIPCTFSFTKPCEKHLKSFEPEKSGHSIKNIDYIYMINLEQRPERWKKASEQLSFYQIFPYRFSAVNGWELSLEAINDVGLKYSFEMEPGFIGTSYHFDQNFEPSHENMTNYGQTYFCHCLARGTIGIYLSHISILQNAYDAGHETIWVLEDDIEVLQDPNLLSSLIEKLDDLVGKKGWDVLFTDRDMRDFDKSYKPCYWQPLRPDFLSFSKDNHYAKRTVISDDFWQIGARYGAHSMILRRSGIEKILKFFKAHQIFLPYDLDFILPRGIKLFAVLNDIVSNQTDSESDNGGPNYLKRHL